MPLKKGYSRRSIAANVKGEKARGKSPKQAVAIALSTARKAAEDAGKPEAGPKPRGRRRRAARRMAGRLKGMRR